VNSSTRSIAVLRARLPYTDRRALSQAWFSALGLAERDTPRRARPVVASATPQTLPRTGAALSAPLRRTDSARASVVSPASARSTFRATEPALSHASTVPRKVETEKARAVRYPPVHASFRLEVDGGRVRVVLRREGNVLHVVALCSPKHVAHVRTALARAAAHLRASGETLYGEVRALGGADGAA
jgi:hypothetical protein